MDQLFIQQLYTDHLRAADFPSPRLVDDWLNTLLQFLFPEYSERHYPNLSVFTRQFETNGLKLLTILDTLQDELPAPANSILAHFYEQLPEVRERLREDAAAILAGDPAARSLTEVISTYPGFYAIAVYRIAHCLCALAIPLVPRILSELAHKQTGVEIHPGAKIGRRFCIDHGTGIVIGETVQIGDDVKIYQGVTLGALSVKKEMALTKRHPTIEDRVIIYAGATILGGETVIGADSIIGGNTWIVKSAPPGSRIYYRAEEQD
ncbi:MAG: serine O-acetyltransferase EpsC [Bacteroidota bacterium]